MIGGFESRRKDTSGADACLVFLGEGDLSTRNFAQEGVERNGGAIGVNGNVLLQLDISRKANLLQDFYERKHGIEEDALLDTLRQVDGKHLGFGVDLCS